ncbi:DeoR/GlpR family DNA-binding transcription regulator [Pseudactinotalea sp. Z1748]|uniref:DeoR/GlpR family DNA-binding transcription regulator n=1 Tax=Pseudactinotalea sp. Z1748 TaxID=3413027 RepID=UPI003C7E109F
MRQQQRLNQILDALSTDGHLTIDEIVDQFGISAATARRDLGILSRQRLATRTHGGAVSMGNAYELPLQYKIARNAESKLAIAATAVELLSPGETVGLTGGTTTTEVARVLGADPRLCSDRDPSLTVVTNALNIAYELAIRRHIKLVVTGGVARPLTFELVGPMVGDAIAGLVLDWAIVGADGLDARYGVTTVDDGEATVNRELVKAARKVMVVADRSKLGHSTFARICTLGEVTTLVTDAQPEPELGDALARAGVEVLVSPPKGSHATS